MVSNCTEVRWPCVGADEPVMAEVSEAKPRATAETAVENFMLSL